jgi:hypothetical protein
VHGDIEEEAAIVVVDGKVAVAGLQRDRLGDLVLQRAVRSVGDPGRTLSVRRYDLDSGFQSRNKMGASG